jgi:hypothetical protein
MTTELYISACVTVPDDFDMGNVDDLLEDVEATLASWGVAVAVDLPAWGPPPTERGSLGHD